MIGSFLSGLGVALATPFNDDFSIDFEALKVLIDHVISGGVDYIVALGTTAETPTLTLEEKILLTDFIRQHVSGRVPLVIGIGGNNTQRVATQIKDWDLSGYSAVLSVTPYYNRPSQHGLLSHFSVIAKASSLPLILYNVPLRTGVNLSAETTLRLARLHNNIIGIKEASGDMVQIKEIIQKKDNDFMVISGDDALTCSLMQSGACGVISVMANAFPSLIKRIVKNCINQNFSTANSYQSEIKDLCTNIFHEGNPAGMKFALSKLGIAKNVLRLPLVAVSKTTQDKISKSIEMLGL